MMVYLLEAAAQVIIGSILIFATNLLVFPILGIEATIEANVYLVAINTVVAFLKSYGVRAMFRKINGD